MYTKWLCAANDITNTSYLVPNHDHSRLLIQNQNTILNLSNICTHKQATILKDRGILSGSIVCPIHLWSWDRCGQIKHARGFDLEEDMNLVSNETYQWNGHVFSGSQRWLSDIDKLGDFSKYVDISNYKWHSHESLTYNFDWKIFMEIFLDLYHVRSFHPGLRSLTDCSQFEWAFGEEWICQAGRFRHQTPKEPNYKGLYEFYENTGLHNKSKYGAVWLCVYPNIMIEYYPGSIIISTIWPNGHGKCTNHLEFYYETGLLDKFPKFAEVNKSFFMLTADEDEEIGNRIQEGRSLVKTYKVKNHPFEEAGYQPFYEWLNKNKGDQFN